MIKVENLLKVFNKKKSNEVRAIDGVTLEFPEKGLVAIYGASGSGKTTLMNALGGLDKFDGGEIIMDGNVYTKSVGDKYRIENIGYVFQNYLLDERLDVYHNVAQGLRTEGVKDEEVIFKRVMTALDNVGMRDYFKRNVTTLSGGQQQRVAIARAMVKGAKIILADEPTGNLDENNTRTVMELLKAMSKNCLVIVVTHEEDIIERYADSVIEIKDGKVNTHSEGAKTVRETSDKTKIFLGDKEKKQIAAQNVDIEYYGESVPVKLKIVNDKGRIYLKASCDGITLLNDDSETQFVDATRAQYSASRKDDTTFAIERLGPVKSGKTGRLFSFGTSFLSGLKSLFGKKKKRFALVTVSVFLMMIATVLMLGAFGSDYYYYQTVGDYINPELVTVTLQNGEAYKEVTDYVASRGYDIDYSYVSKMSVSNLQLSIKGFRSFEDFSSRQMDFVINDIEDTKDMEWLYRSETNADNFKGIVLSSALADRIIASWSYNSSANIGGYGFLQNAETVLNNYDVVIAGVVKDDVQKVYVNELYYLESIYSFSAGEKYGLEIPDGVVYIPNSLKSFYTGETTKIYDKRFDIVFTDEVTKESVNGNELRAIKERYGYRQFLCFLTPQADQLSKNLLTSGKAFQVSSRVLDNSFEIREAYDSAMNTLYVDIVLVAVLFVMAFLMFCASLSSKVKEIGLYRAIGVSSKNIVYKFFVESMAFVSVCVLSVYLLIGLPILILSNGHIFYFTPALYFASLGIILAGMLIVSIFPILFYIRKSPVQILSKYDL